MQVRERCPRKTCHAGNKEIVHTFCETEMKKEEEGQPVWEDTDYHTNGFSQDFARAVLHSGKAARGT